METIALVLGAGGARGLAHIHSLKAFDDLGIKPSFIAGTSMGSLMGAAYCSGMSGADIEGYISEKINDRLSLVSEAFRIRPANVQSFLADGGFRIGELNLENILSVFLPNQIEDDFEALSIPLAVIATDYYAEKEHAFQRGSLRPALAASAAMPAIFLPVQIDGVFFIDGSTTDPCPIDTAYGKANHVIAIDVSGGTHGAPNLRPKKIDAMYAASQLMQQSIVRSRSLNFPNALLLRPPVSRFRPLDFFKAKQILEQTAALYEDTKRTIDELLKPRN